MVNLRESLMNNLWKRAGLESNSGLGTPQHVQDFMGPAPTMNSFDSGSVPSSQVGGTGSGPSMSGSDINTTSPTGIGALSNQNAGGTPVSNNSNPAGSELINPTVDSTPIGQFGTNSSGVPMIGHPDAPSNGQSYESAFSPGTNHGVMDAYAATRPIMGTPIPTNRDITQTGNSPSRPESVPRPVPSTPEPLDNPTSTPQLAGARADGEAGIRPVPGGMPYTPPPVKDTTDAMLNNNAAGRRALYYNPDYNPQDAAGVSRATNEISSTPVPTDRTPIPVGAPAAHGSPLSAKATITPPSPKTMIAKSSEYKEFNNTQRFAIGFIKQAMDSGLDEVESIALLKESVAPPQTMVTSGISDMVKGVARPPAPKLPGPPSLNMKPQGNPLQQQAQNIPPVLKPVQATPTLNTTPNPGQQDLQEFEQQRQMTLGASPNPLLNNQVNSQLTNLPPLQAQELIRYLQSKPPIQ